MNTICDAFQATVLEAGEATAIRTRDGREVTWNDYRLRVERIAAGLHRIGLRAGDTIALMMANRPEFHFVDTAAAHLGAIPFSIYNTSSAEQIRYQMEDSGARIAVVERQFRDRVRAEIVVTVEDLAELEHAGEQTDLDFERAWKAVDADDVLTLIYTSGTTGPPKAVQVTHRNVLASGRSYQRFVDLPIGGHVVSYLPMAHIAERNCSHYFAIQFRFVVTCCPDAREIASCLSAVRPHWFFGVPRIFEKMRAAILADADEPLRQAIAAGRTDDDRIATLRREIGLDRVRALNVGAAPTTPEVIEFFGAIGLPLGELWGMSETTGLGTCNPADDIRTGTAGVPMPGVAIRIADDGEVELRGDNVTPGYYRRPDLTREAMTDDGWLRTGDVGRLDGDGRLVILDRKKEIIINAAGKNMSPTFIESRIKAATPLIGSAVAIGDRRPYNVALIVLDPEGVAGFARAAGIGGASVAEIAGHPRIEQEIAAAVQTANASLSSTEQIKRFLVLPSEWQPGSDELTPTMKLRRKQIEAKYADRIDELYAAARVPTTGSPG